MMNKIQTISSSQPSFGGVIPPGGLTRHRVVAAWHALAPVLVFVSMLLIVGILNPNYLKPLGFPSSRHRPHPSCSSHWGRPWC